MTRTKQTLALTPLRKCASGKLASLVILALSAAGDTYAQGPIHQLSYAAPNWAWTDVQLPGPGASQSSGVAAFNTTPNNQFHIFYQDVSNNIHGLYFNGSLWSDGNMTAAIPGASALPYGSGISGFSIGNFQYVYFVGSDQHIHEFSYVDNWVDTDVTERSRGATPKPIGKLVSYATSPNNQRHVYYVATDATIHQLYWNGIQWSDENLTSFTGGALADTSNIGGCAVGNFQYIFFASHGHLHMYSYVNSWTDTDWTDISGISNVFYVSGFGTPGTTKFHMYFSSWVSGSFFDNSNQLSYDVTDPEAYSFSTLSNEFPVSDPGFIGFATTPNDQLHLFISMDGVEGAYFNGTYWSYGNTPGSLYAYASNGIGGFSIGNAQYVYYVHFPPPVVQ